MFTLGLAEDIHVDVELQDPQDLEMAMSLARAYEKKVVRSGGASCSNTARAFLTPQNSSSTPMTNSTTAVGQHVGTNGVASHQICLLTPSEMADHRRKGLCFNCDEKFVRNHKYTHLFFIEYDDMMTNDHD